MVLRHRQASGLFSFLGSALPDGDPNLCSGDYTMNEKNTSELVKSLSYEEHPLHVFLYDGKIAFLTKEVGEILGILKPTQSVRQSKTLQEGIDHATIPAISLGQGNSLFPRNVNHVSILFQSGFFLYVLRSNKEISVEFTRWVIREAIPIAMEKPKALELTKDIFKLMELSSKHKCPFAKQLLIDKGFIEAPEKNKQITIDDIDLLDDSGQGGDDE
jgi:prophage antirepressor-like protein